MSLRGCATGVLGRAGPDARTGGPAADPVAEAFLKALEDFACRRGTPTPVELYPHQGRPWEGEDVLASALVIVAPVAGDADATTGATALSTALIGGLSEITATVLTPGATSDSVVAVSYTAPNGSLTIVNRLELSFHSLLAARAIRVSVQVAGKVVLAEGEIVEPVVALDARATERELVEVRVRNLDARSAYLLGARISGWTYPIERRDDKLAVRRTPARDPKCRR